MDVMVATCDILQWDYRTSAFNVDIISPELHSSIYLSNHIFIIIQAVSTQPSIMCIIYYFFDENHVYFLSSTHFSTENIFSSVFISVYPKPKLSYFLFILRISSFNVFCLIVFLVFNYHNYVILVLEYLIEPIGSLVFQLLQSHPIVSQLL